MGTPAEKLKRLRLTDGKSPFPEAYSSPKPGSYGTGKQGPLTEALRAKRERQKAREEGASTSSPTPSRPTAATPSPVKSADSSETSGKKSFSQAFREARNSGKDTFTWNGKKYTTEMAGEKKRAEEPEPKAERETTEYDFGTTNPSEFKRGGKVKKYAKGGSVSSRADGGAQRGKTRGRMM